MLTFHVQLLFLCSDYFLANDILHVKKQRPDQRNSHSHIFSLYCEPYIIHMLNLYTDHMIIRRDNDK